MSSRVRKREIRSRVGRPRGHVESSGDVGSRRRSWRGVVRRRKEAKVVSKIAASGKAAARASRSACRRPGRRGRDYRAAGASPKWKNPEDFGSGCSGEASSSAVAGFTCKQEITNEGSREGASVTEPEGTTAAWEGRRIAESVEGESKREVVQRRDDRCEEEKVRKARSKEDEARMVLPTNR